jgi:hypothetical protein
MRRPREALRSLIKEQFEQLARQWLFLAEQASSRDVIGYRPIRGRRSHDLLPAFATGRHPVSHKSAARHH